MLSTIANSSPEEDAEAFYEFRYRGEGNEHIRDIFLRRPDLQ